MRPCVLFRTVAGPRIGFGHLVRSQRLAAALGVRGLVALDAGRGSPDAAAVLGCRIVSGAGTSLLRTLAPSLLVIDHPNPRAGKPWIREARRLGIPTASIHDLGIAPCESDCSIDGSVAPGPMDLAGLEYAIVDPRVRRVRRDGRRLGPPIVLVAFGGGHRRRLARAVARAVVARRPDVAVRIACGFGSTRTASAGAGIALVPQKASLADEYRRATVAVLAGGVSLYEACVAGVPAIGVSIVPAQRPSVAGLAQRGAVIDGGVASPGRSSAGAAGRISRLVCALLDAPARQQSLARTAMRLIDGRGVERVAAALRRLPRPVASTGEPTRRSGSSRSLCV